MIKINKFIKYIILTLMVLLPILNIKFFYSRITTLTIVSLIFIALLLTLINNKKSRKPFIYLFIYYLLVLIYLFIDYKHSIGFKSLFPHNFNYSLYFEITTILKLITPITLLFVLKYNKITKKEYVFIIKYWIIMIAGSIILTNIFKIGLTSYGDSKIIYNIFEWKKSIYYMYSASKGFFVFANQTACVMIMLLILSCYMFFKENKNNLLYILMLSIAMMILGTRVSSLGGLLILICTSLVMIGYQIFIKKKIKKDYILILIPIILWIVLLPITPYSNRNIELNNANINNIVPQQISFTSILEEDKEKIESEEEKMRKYIDENHDESRMPELFYKKYYSYEYDPYFWYNFVKKYEPYQINYRLMEISIVERIKEVDNRTTMNNLFGISNSRIQNVVNIERDIVLHYYAFGIIGMIILLIVYPLLVLKNSILILKNKTKAINYISLSIVLIFIICSLLTGNIMNSIYPTITLIFIIHK